MSISVKQRRRINRWLSDLTFNLFQPKRDDIFKELKGFVMFIGYPRSGHTLVGSLLDAHPNAVISHELYVLDYFKRGWNKNKIFSRIFHNSEAFTRSGREWMGYQYRVPNQWQGRFKEIHVIGDKSGGRSSRAVDLEREGPWYEDVSGRLHIPLKLVHVIRNPMDNISTMVTRTNKRNEKAIGNDLLKLKIDHYFKLVAKNESIRKAWSDKTIDIYLEDFINDPKRHLEELGSFLEIRTDDEYLADCSSIVWEKPNKSRGNVEKLWSAELVDEVRSRSLEVGFLRKYFE